MSATTIDQRDARARPGFFAWASAHAERLRFGGLLLGTAVLYFWNLTSSGWANSFYAAAVQAGTQSWTAFLFGASDIAASITVDKPPASLWVMALSGRIFGFSSWSMLMPEVLMGVASVALVYASVKRWFGSWPALLAGASLALTPVAALMFRFNNPDALLVLLMTVATYAVLRGIEDGKIRWMVLAGAAIGFGFLTKQLQVLLVVPGFAMYLFAAKGRVLHRVSACVAALGAMVVAAGWWVALVELWPAESRPYIGGSQNNSFLELTFGYNGFGRLTGDETGSVGGMGGGNGGGMWGETGITRLVTGEFASQISWLLPAALVAVVVGIVATWRRPRTDMRRASIVVWGAWLLVTALVFSFMSGIFHAYYTVALAPAIAALVGILASLLWERRSVLWTRLVSGATVLITGGWSFVLLSQTSSFLPWLRWVVLAATIASVIVFALVQLVDGEARRQAAVVAVGLGIIASLAGPLAYTLQTVSTAHSGSIVTAGPASSTGFGGGGGGGGAPGGMQGGDGQGGGQGGGFPGGGQQDGMGESATGTGDGMMGGSGLLGGSNVSDSTIEALSQDADQYTWIAATTGSQNAASYQLATGYSVMPIGGFNGSDPSPTLEQFQAMVDAGEIHYYLAGGGMGGQSMGGSDAASEIQEWVEANFTEVTLGDTTAYDLTQPAEG